ncbi:MAG: asparagine synthase-related protein [Acidobacteriota bacterium]
MLLNASEAWACRVVTDNEVVVGDLRFDSMPELASELRSELEGSADPGRLIAAAWRRWGDASPRRLHGDFSFVLWDAERRTLFAARDPFGVKPLYWAHDRSGRLVLSNVLDTVYDAVEHDGELDDDAIADFLLFGHNRNLATTTWRGIACVPPAHTLVWRRGWQQPRIERWWRPRAAPAETLDEAGVEQFRAALSRAVRDRLPASGKVALMMSGGLDSTALAALAKQAGADVVAHTIVYERLIADREGEWAQRAGAHLGIPVELLIADDHRHFASWRCGAEPVEDDVRSITDELERRVLGHAKVLFTGLGGDPLLLPWRGYALHCLSRGRVDRLARYVSSGLRRRGRLPPLGLHGRVARWWGRRRWREGFPSWLAEDFVRRLDLETRWREFWYPPWPRAPRAEAEAAIIDPVWTRAFEQRHPVASGRAFEERHPFFDRRLVELALRLPAVPWCVDKWILRHIMIDTLPESVRFRPKTPLIGVPGHGWDTKIRDQWPKYLALPAVAQYLVNSIGDRDSSATSPTSPSGDRATLIRPMSLALWIATRQRHDRAPGGRLHE